MNCPCRTSRSHSVSTSARSEHGGDAGSGELDAFDAARLQHLPLWRVQTLQLQADQVAQFLGQGQFAVRVPRGERLGQVHHEQGQAAAMPVHERCQTGRVAVLWIALCQVGGGIGQAQRFQAQFLRLRAHVQVELQAMDRMPAHGGLDRTIGRQHQQARGLRPLRDRRKQVDAGVVAPVQVLQHQHQRPRCAQAFQNIVQFAALATGTCPRRAAFERTALFDTEQPAQLTQPRRRVAAQQLQCGAVAVVPAQVMQCLDHRPVRFFFAVMLRAATARQQWALGCGLQFLDEALHQGGLANAGFAGDENELTLSAERAGEGFVQALERFVAADRRAARSGRVPDRSAADRSDEAETDAMHGGDVARRPGIVAQRRAQQLDLERQRRFRHYMPWPDRIEQRRLADHPTRLAQQRPQQQQGLGLQLHRHAIAQQRALRRSQRERPESVAGNLHDAPLSRTAVYGVSARIRGIS